jgi:undecaprenyl-diphosphatase
VLFAPRYIKSWKTYREVIISFIPTAVVGFIFYKLIKTYLVGNLAVAGAALIVGGILMIWLERRYARLPVPHSHTLPFWDLIGIGLAQAVAVFPGVSRSGAIAMYGLARGMDRDMIIEFAFLLAIPTMLAAAGYDLLKSHASFSHSEWMTLAVGFIATFITALLVIKWFIGYIKTHSFESFGWYRIVIGAVILITVLL